MSKLHTQVAGKHYVDMAIPPVEFCEMNNLGACAAHAIGYIARHDKKGEGAKDIKKAIHMLEILLELRYGEEVQEQVRDGGKQVAEKDLPLRAGEGPIREAPVSTSVHP